MSRFLKRPSASMGVALLALFIALSGNALAAPVNFLLNTSNTSSSQTTLTGSAVAGKALQITNTNTAANATALGLNVASGHAPFNVNSNTKVAKLNADLLDGLSSNAFLQNTAPLTLSGNGANVIHGTDTGGGNGVQGDSASGNGVQGISNSGIASGVYGENDAGGYGLAARSNAPGGVAVFGEATGQNGLAGDFSGDVAASGSLTASSLNTGSLNCSACVTTADLGDGSVTPAQLAPGAAVQGNGRIITNRLVNATAGDTLLNIPFMGQLKVKACTDGTSGQLLFDTVGTGAVDFGEWGERDGGSTVALFITTSATTDASEFGGYVLTAARNTGGSTIMVTMWVTWNANGCRFQAQALQSPAL